MHFRLASEPGQLPLCVVAMPLLRRFYRGLDRHCPRKHSESLTIAKRIQRLHRPIAIQQPARLLHEPCRKHLVAAPVEPLIQRLSWRIEPDPQQAIAGQRIAPQHRRHRLPPGNAHLDRANHLGNIVGMDARGRRRIKSRQQSMQPPLAMLSCAPLQPIAQTFLPRRPGKQPLRQRPQIEACSSSHDGQLVALRNLFEHRPRAPAVLTRSERLVQIGDIDQVMRQPRPLFRDGFAVPMSMPRYTATESQLTISPPNRSPSASESAVFPLPVGPSNSTASGNRTSSRALAVRAGLAMRAALMGATSPGGISTSHLCATTTKPESLPPESAIQTPGFADKRAAAPPVALPRQSSRDTA